MCEMRREHAICTKIFIIFFQEFNDFNDLAGTILVDVLGIFGYTVYNS